MSKTGRAATAADDLGLSAFVDLQISTLPHHVGCAEEMYLKAPCTEVDKLTICVLPPRCPNNIEIIATRINME